MKSCHNCKSRQVGCHSTCISYILYDAVNQRIREENLKQTKTRMDINSHVSLSIKRWDRGLPK